MCNVLLVDDERVILEGISQVVDWAGCGMELVGTARNGLEAYEKIALNPPDIVISDISMPGLDGIGLVEKTAASFPDVRFIMLSGYKDFDYARRAMQYGVKHYLLKPCNEAQIVAAVTELLQEKEEQKERDDFVNEMRLGLNKMLPHVKEQFLKEFITNKTYGSRDLIYYQELFELELEGKMVRMILFRLEDCHEYEHMFALKNIAQDILKGVLLSTTIDGHLLILLQDRQDTEAFIQEIEAVRSNFSKFYKLEVTIALSNGDLMIRSRQLYQEMLQCMNHRFYIGEGSLILQQDVELPDMGQQADFALNEEKFCLLVKSGNMDEVRFEVERLFQHLDAMRLEIGVTRSYILQLYAALIRICPADEIATFTSHMTVLTTIETLSALKSFVYESVGQLTTGYYKSTINRQSSTVDKMIEIIHSHYMQAELSLNGVANEVLYMNPDYLGKIFKKVTGENFSHYVNKVRIEQAADYIRRSGDVKIFELADMFGFGGNSQYFSQVFKKCLGMTPTEYKKCCDQS